jgi:hypothetical protein
MEMLKSFFRFAYQPRLETARIVATNYPWKTIIAVIVASGIIDIIDPTLYTENTPLWEDIVFNFFWPGIVVAATFVLAYLTRWLFWISGVQTALKDNVLIYAWWGMIFSILYIPFTVLEVLGMYAAEPVFYLEILLNVFAACVGLIAYQTLTRASWLHTIGATLATFLVCILISAVVIGVLDIAGLLPANFWEG